MMLQAPDESPYDLRFVLLGFEVRVAWPFWIAGLVFGFDFVQVMDQILLQADRSPGLPALYLLWLACFFLSILIHEMGHTIAFRQYGIDSYIVLYHFGGLAIPRESFGSGSSYTHLKPIQQVWISLAGPVFQICSAILLIGGCKLAGYRIAFLPFGMDRIAGLSDGQWIENGGLFALTTFYVWPSIVWGLLNLVPVWPLDGGQIMRALFQIFGGNMQQSLWVSVIAAGALAAYGFSTQQLFIGALFLILAVQNFQILQQFGGWRY